jgi:hypothetical protein
MMTENNFWKMVEFMGWDKACSSGEYRPYNRIIRKFMDMYSEDEAIQFNVYYSAKYKELDDELMTVMGDEIRNGVLGGDDAYGDLLSQVIGNGMEFYYSVLADMSLLDNLEPFESFAYAIPNIGEDFNDYADYRAEKEVAALEEARLLPKPYAEEEYYIIDNGGFVDGAHPTYGAAMEAAKECKNDPNFQSKGNMTLVKVEALLDNFMNDIES